MKAVIPREQYLRQLRALYANGFDAYRDLLPVQDALAAARALHPSYRDHALSAPLAGYRACHLGEFKGNTLVLIYRDTGRRISWEAIGEHDSTYTEMQKR